MTFIKNNLKKIIALALLGAGIIGGSLYYLNQQAQTGIFNYNPAIDRTPVIELFKKNWSWLLIDPNYSLEYMLDTSSSGKAPETFGNLHFKVYRDNGKTAGFLAYHKERFYEGRLLFLAVDEQYRGKGYAPKLVQEAINNLKDLGAHIIYINTRVDNVKARKIYEAAGFTQFWTDGTYVQYKKSV